MNTFFDGSRFTERASARQNTLIREPIVDGWPHFENLQLRVSLLPYRTQSSRGH